VAVEAGERGERAALDLDDRDAQRRRVQDDALEGLAALGCDEQAARGTLRGERLFDRSSPGDQLLIGSKLRGGPGRAGRWPGGTSWQPGGTSGWPEGSSRRPASARPGRRGVAAVFGGSRRSSIGPRRRGSPGTLGPK